MEQAVENLTRIIRSRRSVFPKSYTPEVIPRETIELILANANYAPSHKLTEPWRFTVFRGPGLSRLANEMGRIYQEHTPEKKFKQSKLESTKEKILKASCVIAISMKTHPDKLPEWEELASVACAVQNMWLTASALHVGAYWSTPGTIGHLKDFLKLGSEEKCIGLFYMGFHEEPPREAKRRSIDKKTTWVEE